MRIARRSTLPILLLLGLAVAPVALLADEPRSFQIHFTAGGLLSDFDTSSAKAEEYRDLSDGFLLDDLDLALLDAASPWSLSLTGDHLARQDESLDLAVARAGRFRLGVSWDRTPHLLYRDAATIFSGSKGDYRISDAFRNTLEGLVSAPGAGTAQTVRAALAGLARPMDLAVQRDRAELTFGLQLTRAWDLRVRAANEDRSGNDRISAGTYIRRQAVTSDPTSGPNFFDRERVEPRGIELPKPIDTEVRETEIGSSLHGAAWLLDFGWEGSSFDNDHNALTWENPFEGGPGAASSSAGLDPGADQEPAAPVGNSGNRGRFTQAQLALDPDNDYQRAYMTAGFSLPGRTRINTSFSSATMKQDQAFLAYTLNPAVLFSNGPDGVAGTADDVRAADVPRPAADLGGEVKTERLDLRVTSRPLDALSLRARYGRYDYDDRSRAISWPGYASAGDSYFRRNVGKRDAAGNKILINEVADYTRTVWSAGGGWRFGRVALLDAEYTNTAWDYEARQVESTQEDAFQLKLQLTPNDRITARLSYLDASRDFDGPYAVGLETSRLRAFDVWNRDRTRWGAEIGFLLGEHTTLDVGYTSWKDEYPGVVPLPSPVPASNPFAPQPYGLNEATNETLSMTLTYAAETWTLAAAAGLDGATWESLAVSKTSLTSDTVQFDPANRWTRTEDDDTLWASLSLDAQLAEAWKLTGELFYQDYDGRFKTANPATPTINSGFAYAFPASSSQLFTGDLTLEWAFSPRLGFGVRYLYEPYRLDDFAWDVVEPYMQGILKETGDNPGDVRDMTAWRLYWLDATYSDYTANVLSVFARLRL